MSCFKQSLFFQQQQNEHVSNIVLLIITHLNFKYEIVLAAGILKKDSNILLVAVMKFLVAPGALASCLITVGC